MKKIIFLCLLSLFSSPSFAHGNHGGNGSPSIEGELASGSHIHLPVRIESSGDIVFGYEWPFSSHSHDGHDDEESHSSGGDFHIGPTAVIGGDLLDRIVSKDFIEVNRSKDVLRSSPGTGFINVKNSKLMWGLGLELHKHFKVNVFGISIGLNYLKNQSAYSEIHLKDLSERGRELKLPGNLPEFDQWRPGEKLVYASSGSIVFTAGTGIDPLVHGGAILSASGTWMVKVQKLDSTTMHVSLSSLKGQSFGAEIDGSFVVLSMEKLKSFEKDLSFNLNMAHEQSFLALKKAYRGDFREVQEMAKDESLASNVLSSKGTMKGKGINVGLIFPFLFGANHSRYTQESFMLSDNQNKIYSAMTYQEKSTRGLWSKHKKELEQFSATYVDEAHEDHRDLFYAAHFKWHYEKDAVDASTVLEKLKILKLQTGIEGIDQLRFPQNKLGHLRISFDMSFTEFDIFSLLNFLSAPKFSLALSHLEDYLLRDPQLELCKEMGNGAHFQTFEERSGACRRELWGKTKNQLSSLAKMSKEALGAVKNKNPQLATALISKIGTLLTNNPFILKGALPELVDVKIQFVIEGEKVKRQMIPLN